MDDRIERIGGMLHVVVYLVVWIVMVLGLNIVGAVGVMLVMTLTADDPAAAQAQLNRMAEGDLPGMLFVAVGMFQFPLMLAAVEVTRWLVDRTWFRHRALDRVRPDRATLYALRPASPPVIGMSLLLGLTVGWLPGWLSSRLQELLPSLDLGALEMVHRALTEEGPLVAAGAVFLIVVAAPLVEELVIRGFTWHAMSRFLPPWGVWVGTSLLFAAYHMDPVQSSALVFTALVLGWVRWVTGSIWPGIALHFANNALAVVAMMWLPGLDEPGLALSLVFAALTVAGCGATAAWLREDR